MEFKVIVEGQLGVYEELIDIPDSGLFDGTMISMTYMEDHLIPYLDLLYSYSTIRIVMPVPFSERTTLWTYSRSLILQNDYNF